MLFSGPRNDDEVWQTDLQGGAMETSWHSEQIILVVNHAWQNAYYRQYVFDAFVKKRQDIHWTKLLLPNWCTKVNSYSFLSLLLSIGATIQQNATQAIQFRCMFQTNRNNTRAWHWDKAHHRNDGTAYDLMHFPMVSLALLTAIVDRFVHGIALGTLKLANTVAAWIRASASPR